MRKGDAMHRPYYFPSLNKVNYRNSQEYFIRLHCLTLLSNVDLPFLMKYKISIILFFLTASLPLPAQLQIKPPPVQGFERRIREYIDTLNIIDTHEHLVGPEMLNGGFFLDFSLLLLQNGYDDLISAGMPDTLYDKLFNEELQPSAKWEIVEPWWQNSFNTSFNRIILYGIRRLYGIDDLNASTVGPLSEKIRKAYETNWFDRILLDSCRIKYLIKDGNHMPGRDVYVKYVKRFDDWLLLSSKFGIDSLAIRQLDPIYTLDDLEKSLTLAFEKELKKGMIAVKVFTSYYRTLSFDKVDKESAKKVFRSLVNGDMDFRMEMKDAKPLQDYLFHHLMDLALKYDMPVAIHTGLQAGKGKIIDNSNPGHLTNLFVLYPGIDFVLYHGSFPYGGELSALAKNYRNVYIDMNWAWAVSPTYSRHHLNLWLEMVPVNRLIAFGGDAMAVENVYSELILARNIISDVLSEKVGEGYYSEAEAKKIARMIFYDNAARLYKLE